MKVKKLKLKIKIDNNHKEERYQYQVTETTALKMNIFNKILGIQMNKLQIWIQKK